MMGSRFNEPSYFIFIKILVPNIRKAPIPENSPIAPKASAFQEA
jgi:hypothetical protein